MTSQALHFAIGTFTNHVTNIERRVVSTWVNWSFIVRQFSGGGSNLHDVIYLWSFSHFRTSLKKHSLRCVTATVTAVEPVSVRSLDLGMDNSGETFETDQLVLAETDQLVLAEAFESSAIYVFDSSDQQLLQ